MPRTLYAEPVVRDRAHLNESPLWDDRHQVLRWVDILAGRVHGWDPATGERTLFEAGLPVGAVALRQSGGLVLAVADGFAVLDGEQLTRIADLDSEDGELRMNDAVCDPEGRLLAGTMAYSHEPGRGTLHRLDPDHTVHTALSSVTISNGLDWSLDGATAYYADSPTREVRAYRYHEGRLLDPRPFVTTEHGVPDGLAVDAEGGVWVAVAFSGTVRRYLPDGTLDTVVRVPATVTTSCAFGGPGLDTLYITTATENLTPAQLAEQPLAGGVFACSPGVRGRAANRFRG
ncbi:SMP-30/gluconolactonase/LRE family protein [Kitasatospora sp. DSM 101779]|uniref:SMP-30/gluconolactonase/LRE family protein n=1 Tax=Kitasatospora sp. DSM 101779 TaxID=2853165 RepID=UPI0021D9D206|nr:SMP-30/gluconolactonase/LRE family protein [Kitasatospora sp. DSM 101779]MCU7825792.1 SMP-30/gluconolactonase/LRE family protein [Kitasatospora sp. DSM 101779]